MQKYAENAYKSECLIKIAPSNEDVNYQTPCNLTAASIHKMEPHEVYVLSNHQKLYINDKPTTN